mmetsp:Transcript_21392/g.69199  ORF Transcript_21392/g.69199 Transcript_21392/m.69199 type:complete len:1632 (-) Transcript_21392:71-4966(-)
MSGSTFVTPQLMRSAEAPLSTSGTAAGSRGLQSFVAARPSGSSGLPSAALGVGLGLTGALATGKKAQRKRRNDVQVVALAAAKKKAPAPVVVEVEEDAGGLPSAEEFQNILTNIQNENQTLGRFLADEPGLQDTFLKMAPVIGSDELCDSLEIGTNEDFLSKLGNIKGRGSVKTMEWINRQKGDSITTLLVCNTDAGVVCGLAHANKSAYSKRLAAQQVLERASFDLDPAKELKAAGGSGEERATQASEAVEALAEHLKNFRLTIVQPTGGAYCAAFTGIFQSKDLFGATRQACESKEAAIAQAGEAFLREIRLTLRLRSESPHAPKEWAENMSNKISKETCTLPDIGDKTTEDLLSELMGTDEERAALNEALEEATQRQLARMAAMQEMVLNPEGDRIMSEDNKYVARRKFVVKKPEEEDWKREEIRGKLPAEEIRQILNEALERNQAVIVSGGTGSGKSTQLPQFILDDFEEWEKEGGAEEELNLEVGSVCEVFFEEVWYPSEILEVSEDGKTIKARYFEGDDEEEDVDVAERVRHRPSWMRAKPSIVVTQPRRIAAISLAERVSYERYQDECGNEIGHACRGATINPTAETGTIEYCTVGTLLRKVVSDPLLCRYNTVILDEVHERDLYTDFLLILLREVLPRRPDLRLILMSATLDVQTFVNYLPGASVVEVPSGTRYPVEEIHLEDAFFKDMQPTERLLESEALARTNDGISSGKEHEWNLSSSTSKIFAATQVQVQEQVANFIGQDDEAARVWKEYSEEKLGGEVDPAKVDNVDCLREFLVQAYSKQGKEKVAEQEDDDGTEKLPPTAVLEDQIAQLTNYSDDARQAWTLFREEQAGGKDWNEQIQISAEELVGFLESQGIRPWKAGRASWEITSSQNYWGSESSSLEFLKVAEETIFKVYEELLDFDEADENGAGSILCFLPGWQEIKTLADRLEKSTHASKLWVIKLHSSMTKDEQQQIFESPEPGQVKVILATNIAESSVTINDVRVVIDSGLHREMTYDPKRRMSFLDTVWICQSNAVQRKGRAGRVREGKVYRLYSREQFASVPWRPAPEMQRCNLANTALQSISLGRDPREFLAAAPDPPTVSAVEAAMAELVMLDAIKDGAPPTMLPVGGVLTRFPLEPLLGRAMILGTLFGIPQMTAAIIAIASGRSPFTASREMRDKVKASMRSFCGWSDVVAGLRALTEFEKVYRERGEEEAQAWADHFYLNFFRMMNLSRVKYQLLVDVQRSGLLGAAATEGVNPEEWGWGNAEEGEWEEEGAEGEAKEGEEGEGGVDGEEEEEQQEEEAEVDEEEAAADKAAQESAGATFEGSEVGAGMERSEWLEELKTTNREVQDERLLVAILCAAYPYNLAYRHKPDHQSHKTPSAQKASFDSRSVNATKKDENSEVTVDGPSWWLYSDMRMFNGKTQLVDTTLLSEWDVALFGGLRSKNGEEGKLELDNWINVSAENPKTEELLMKLRDELRKAPIWLSIAASWDKIATAATLRSQTLFSILGSILMKQEPNAETIELMRKFKMPEVEEGLHAHLQAKEEDREDIEERLRKKTVPELKVLLREMDVKDTGKKADLVTRTATALIYGKEEAEKEPDWGSWEGGEGGEGEEGEDGGEGEGEEVAQEEYVEA